MKIRAFLHLNPLDFFEQKKYIFDAFCGTNIYSTKVKL